MVAASQDFICFFCLFFFILFCYLYSLVDSSISDQDVLQEYSSSSPKRSRSDQPADKPTVTSLPRSRNIFATVLQRRNQEAEEDGQVTRSR